MLLDKVKQDALAQLPSDRSEVLSPYVARQMHEAALSSFMFGHIPTCEAVLCQISAVSLVQELCS